MMSKWRTDDPPEDGRFVLTRWPGERPRLLRKIWCDENGQMYAAPRYWQEIPELEVEVASSPGGRTFFKP